MKSKHYSKLNSNQSGIASMVIVILIMTLLTLIVLSMTKNANREQRQALDRQLNSQAFYAAESGINDALEYIKDTPALTAKTDCGPVSVVPGEYFPGKSATIDGANQISYSCVLLDLAPETILFDSVTTDKSKVLPINPTSGDISTLTFSWAEKSANSFVSCDTLFAGGKLPQSLDGDCDAGMLRVELIDPDSSGLSSPRQNLITKNFVAFLRPATSSSGGNYNTASGSPANQGAIWNGVCTAGRCSLTIIGINKPELKLHLRSIYKENTMTISGTTTLGDPIEFDGAQILIDSTGKANDVIKRIQVRRGLTGVYPEFTLQTTDSICKQIQVTSTTEPPINGCP